MFLDERRVARRPKPLTKAETTVWEFLAFHVRGRAISNGQLGLYTGLSHQTIFSALKRLNELDLIFTIPGGSVRASEHRVLVEVLNPRSMVKQ